jgi:UDP-glucuronate 4-epimerase
VGLDNFDPFYDRATKQRNIAAVGAAAGPAACRFELVEGDICDPPAMNELLERVKPAGIIHLAAKAGVRPSLSDPVGYMRTNVVGTQVLLQAARQAACERVVIASSSSVYGDAERVPFSEEAPVNRPISPYAASKAACELLAHTHWVTSAMPTACLRFFTVYGPRQRPDLAISLFLTAIERGEPIVMFGDGSASRDYTFIDDIVRGVLAAYERIDQFGYRVWNLGGSDPVSLSQMIAMVARVVGREPMIKREGKRAGDVERTFADLARSGKELGYSPQTRLEAGIARQWAWMRTLAGRTG